jgi:hypothetical protein
VPCSSTVVHAAGNGKCFNGSRQLPKIDGYKATEVALVLGHWQWTYDEARSVFDRLKVPLAESSLRSMLAAGRTKRLPLPEISRRTALKLKKMRRTAAQATAQ